LQAGYQLVERQPRPGFRYPVAVGIKGLQHLFFENQGGSRKTDNGNHDTCRQAQVEVNVAEENFHFKRFIVGKGF
jgi:hypothetical protein